MQLKIPMQLLFIIVIISPEIEESKRGADGVRVEAGPAMEGGH